MPSSCCHAMARLLMHPHFIMARLLTHPRGEDG
jgi:hypothetical protein